MPYPPLTKASYGLLVSCSSFCHAKKPFGGSGEYALPQGPHSFAVKTGATVALNGTPALTSAATTSAAARDAVTAAPGAVTPYVPYVGIATETVAGEYGMTDHVGHGV